LLLLLLLQLLQQFLLLVWLTWLQWPLLPVLTRDPLLFLPPWPLSPRWQSRLSLLLLCLSLWLVSMLLTVVLLQPP